MGTLLSNGLAFRNKNQLQIPCTVICIRTEHFSSSLSWAKSCCLYSNTVFQPKGDLSANLMNFCFSINSVLPLSRASLVFLQAHHDIGRSILILNTFVLGRRHLAILKLFNLSQLFLCLTLVSPLSQINFSR